ncbi:MAG TPA: hypothetical protein VK622_06745 [Puia sp.]|nr:hypothetical protein [Puia sp.]
MARLLILVVALFYFSDSFPQNGFIILKKRNKPIRYFWKDDRFTFQTRENYWVSGILRSISKDSFVITQEITNYHVIGTSTIRLTDPPYAFADIKALPTRNQLVVYDQQKARIIPGHEKFMWIRNGFIFQVAGAGYAGLNLSNDLIRKEPPFGRKNLADLGISAAIFLLGTLLQLKFDPYIRMGKKFQLEGITLPNNRDSTIDRTIIPVKTK